MWWRTFRLRHTRTTVTAIAIALTPTACKEEVEDLAHPSIRDCALEATQAFVPTAAGMARVFPSIADGCMRYQTEIRLRGSLSIATAYCNRCDFPLALDVLRPLSTRSLALNEQLEMSVGSSLILLGTQAAMLPGCERTCPWSAKPEDELGIFTQILPPHSLALHLIAEVRLKADNPVNHTAPAEVVLVYPRMRPTSSVSEVLRAGSIERLCKTVAQIGARTPTQDSPKVPEEFRDLSDRCLFQALGVLGLPGRLEIDESPYLAQNCGL